MLVHGDMFGVTLQVVRTRSRPLASGVLGVPQAKGSLQSARRLGLNHLQCTAPSCVPGSWLPGPAAFSCPIYSSDAAYTSSHMWSGFDAPVGAISSRQAHHRLAAGREAPLT